MIGRVIAMAILLLLAFYAFWDNALGAGHINPLGILLPFFALKVFSQTSAEVR